jgi:hypothetical protein
MWFPATGVESLRRHNRRYDRLEPCNQSMTQAIFALLALLAQSPAAPANVTGCYELSLGAWSRPIREDSAYHKLPKVVRLDTITAPRGGWVITPDIAYPTGNRRGMEPRWSLARDTIYMRWSTGFNATTVSGMRRSDGDIVGRVDIWHDANIYGNETPWAPVVARRVACPDAAGRIVTPAQQNPGAG